MHGTVSPPRADVADGSAIVPIIAFVGGPISFPNDLLRLTSMDLPEFRVERFASLAELARVGDAGPGAVVTLVLEESYADRLAENHELIQEVKPDAHLALAYRDQDLAVRLLRKLSQRPQLGRVCLLPMRMQYDAWRSILLLLVSGEGYLPHDVVGAAMGPAPLGEPEAADPRPASVPEGPATVLTGREMEVLGLVSQGKQNKSVAAELNLSEHTVKLLMHRIISKLGACNRTEATIWYLSRPRSAAGSPDVAQARPRRPH